MSVDPDHAAYRVLILLKLTLGKLGGKGSDEVSPDKRLIGDVLVLLGRYLGKVHDVEMLINEIFRDVSCIITVIKDVECIKVLVLGIYSVSCAVTMAI